MKLWEKGIPTDKQIEHFTVGNDRELDLVLAKYDALGSIAHAKMLGQIGLLTAEETTSLVDALNDIIADIVVGNFEIEDSFEDVHSKIEYLLTVKLGDAGKKIHTARSRNDQVLVDVHLYLKDELKALKEQVKTLFDFISLPAHLTTGSSIMPHKKNPDVFELIRGKCNKIQALPYEITLITNNLPSGYHRDLQLLKEGLFPALQNLKACLDIAIFSVKDITVKDNILKDKKYDYLFTVDTLNEMVVAGMPFRDAYKAVAEQLEAGTYQSPKETKHTHEGSINNLCLENIKEKMKAAF